MTLCFCFSSNDFSISASIRNHMILLLENHSYKKSWWQIMINAFTWKEKWNLLTLKMRSTYSYYQHRWRARTKKVVPFHLTVRRRVAFRPVTQRSFSQKRDGNFILALLLFSMHLFFRLKEMDCNARSNYDGHWKLMINKPAKDWQSTQKNVKQSSFVNVTILIIGI